MAHNTEKCHVLQIRTKNKKYSYEMCGVRLKRVQCAEDLGAKIKSNLKF